jgi:hypothetical protein
MCLGNVLHTFGKLLTRATIILETLFQSEVYIRSYRHSKWQESQFWEFQDSWLGSSGKNDIWVQIPCPITNSTISRKMVTSPKFGPRWVLWICVCLWFVHAPKIPQLCISIWIIDLLISHFNPHPRALVGHVPQSATSEGAYPNSFFRYFQFGIWIQINQGVPRCVKWVSG